MAAITERELELAHLGPAPYVNRAFVILHPDGATARLAFLDQALIGTEPNFRSAVTLSLRDLTELKDVIDDILVQAKARAR